MKYYFVLLLSLTLSLGLKAQTKIPFGERPPQFGFDVYPVFPKNGGDFNTYIAKQVKAPTTISGNFKQTVTLHINIDSTGKATVVNIYPANAPQDIKDVFIKTVLNSPNWMPATLNGKPVKSTASASFNVEADQAASNFYVHALARARQPKTTGDMLFNAVQISPRFPGGEQAFGKFLTGNIRYPQQAKARNITGRVFIMFVVEKDGSLTDMVVLRDPGYGLGEEAIRVLSSSPKWEPGMQNDKPVRVQYTVPVNFALN